VIALSVRLKGQFYLLRRNTNNEQYIYDIPKTDVHF